VRSLVARERQATAELVAHLAELETRGLHLAAGHGSMFAYCHEGLGLSEHEAYNRIEVARAARRFPVLLELLTAGAVSLTTVRLLAPHLTDANHLEVLHSARGLRKLQVEQIVARLAPKPDVPTTVRKLPVLSPVSVPVPVSATVPALDTPLSSIAATPAAPDPPGVTTITVAAPIVSTIMPPRTTAVVRPLSPERYKLQLTIDEETLEKLRLAKDLLRHAVPSGDDATILKRALTALLTELAKKKFAAKDEQRLRGTSARTTPASDAALAADTADTARTADSPDTADTADIAPTADAAPSADTLARSRHISADVKRAVFLRDHGRCAFVGRSGRRCGERAFVEFHHLRPYSEGGPPTVDNIELRCRRHNRYEWEMASGELFLREAEAWQDERRATTPGRAAAGRPGSFWNELNVHDGRRRGVTTNR
jgi:hypothetical protein